MYNTRDAVNTCTVGNSKKIKNKKLYALRLAARSASYAFVSLIGLCALMSVLVLVSIMRSKPHSGEKLPSNIMINNINVSSMSYTAAHELIAKPLDEQLKTARFSFRCDNLTYIVTGNDISLTVDVKSALNIAINGDLKEYHTQFVFNPQELSTCAQRAAEVFYVAPIEPCAVPNVYLSKPTFAYTDGQKGSKLDIENFIGVISDAISNGNLHINTTPTMIEVSPIKTISQISANTMFRSMFKTSYGESGSLRQKDRIHNILKAARKLNGCVVGVGEEFSFNDYIGPRTYGNGWAPAPGIVNGTTYEMQAGGGICQVSTTLHNALMRAGSEMEITERKNHSWPSSYVDYGLDATVSTGGPNLKFLNNSTGAVYIFAYADNVNYIMTIYIYGEPLPDGVTYDVRAVIDETIEPEPLKTVRKPKWPSGYWVMKVTARKGYKTTAYRDKIIDGKVVETEKLYNYYYRPKQGEKHVGIGSPALPKP